MKGAWQPTFDHPRKCPSESLTHSPQPRVISSENRSAWPCRRDRTTRHAARKTVSIRKRNPPRGLSYRSQQSSSADSPRQPHGLHPLSNPQHHPPRQRRCRAGHSNARRRPHVAKWIGDQDPQDRCGRGSCSSWRRLVRPCLALICRIGGYRLHPLPPIGFLASLRGGVHAVFPFEVNVKE